MSTDNKLNPEIVSDMLNFDPLQAAEDMTGESYKVDESVGFLGLGIALQHNQLKKDMLDSIGDSSFSCELSNYIEICESIGFQLLLREELPDHEYGGDNTDHMYLMWQPEKHILLAFDSWGDGVNGGKFFYNVRFDEKNEEDDDSSKNRWNVTSSGGFCNLDGSPIKWSEKDDDDVPFNQHDYIWVGDHDCREAIKHKIAQLESIGEFVPWVQAPNLYLSGHGEIPNGYMDEHGIKSWGAESDRITNERLNRLPEEVRVLIPWTPRDRD